MMYRVSAALRSAKSFKNIAMAAAKNIAETTGEAATALFVQLGIMAQAERENRRRNRYVKRWSRHVSYNNCGLNGARAVSRRRRQIASGQLRAANGLSI